MFFALYYSNFSKTDYVGFMLMYHLIQDIVSFKSLLYTEHPFSLSAIYITTNINQRGVFITYAPGLLCVLS